MQHRATAYIPPIMPSGVNSIEARVKAMEVAQGYDVREMMLLREELHGLRSDLSELISTLESIQRKAAVWTISALLAACASLVLIVVKVKAPWLVTP